MSGPGSDGADERFLSGVMAWSTADGGPAPHADGSAERYQTRGLLGEGGMGRVFLAWDTRLGREVALKFARSEVPGATERLIHEAAITAGLDHPGIIGVHDLGVDAAGTRFVVLPLVRGRTLGEVAKAADASALSGLVRHLLAACDAVGFAHAMGVVHRDLKPENLLVGAFGQTHVADWGMAARCGATGVGIVGTPGFAAPEQLRGDVPDPRADVWSLGQCLRRVLGASTPKELLAVVQRATATIPDDRYADAAELASELNAWLDGRRVQAHTYRPAELLRRLVVAWRAPLLVAALALSILAVAGVVAVRRVLAERDRARAAEVDATAARARADRDLARTLAAWAVSHAHAGQTPEADTLASGALRLSDDPEDGFALDARGVLTASSAALPRVRVDRMLPCSVARFGQDLTDLLCLGEPTSDYVSSPDGYVRRWQSPLKSVAGASIGPGAAVVVDEQRRVYVVADETTLDAGQVPRGDRVVGGDGRALLLWGGHVLLVGRDGRIGDVHAVCEPGRMAQHAAFAGERAIVACDDGGLVAVQPDGSDQPLGRVERERLGSALSADPTGRRIAAIDANGRLSVFVVGEGGLALHDAPALELLVDAPGPLRGARHLTWSADGQHLAATSEGAGGAIFASESGALLRRLPKRYGGPVGWASNAELRAVAGQTMSTWSFGELTAPRLGQLGSSGLAGVALTTSGDAVAMARSGRVDIVDRRGRTERTIRLGDQVVKSVAFSRDGRRVHAVGVGIAGISTTDRRTGETRSAGDLLYRRVVALDTEPEVLLTASWATGLHRVVGAEVTPLSGGVISDLVLAPDARSALALEEQSGRIVAVDGETGETHPLLEVPGARYLAVAATPAGRVVGAVTSDSLILVTPDGQIRRALPSRGATAIAITGAGTVAVGTAAGVVTLFDVSGAELARFAGHEGRVSQLVAQGPWLFSASWDGTVRRWSPQRASETATALTEALERAWGLATRDLSSE